MKILNPFSFFRKERSLPAQTETRAVNIDFTTGVGLPYTNKTSPQNITTALQLSTIYRCVDVISDAIASQSIDVLQYDSKDGWFANPFHKHYHLLNFEPNKSMNKYSMMKTFIVRTLLDGNGLLEIIRDPIGEPA
jgi:phage portal protein BeeE